MNRILIVEDDPRVAEFLRRGLEPEGYLTVAAPTAAAGLALACEGEFDLVLLDLMLPDGTGVELCKALRARDREVPVLMLTALSDIETKVAGLRSGADDYLTKPFALDELLARCEALLRRRRAGGAPAAARIAVLDLVLDMEGREVSRAGRPVALTAKEFALLHLLAARAGKVVSRAAILDHVWGYSADPLTNVVDVFISNLRAKVDGGHAVKLIQTVRGFGYKLRSS